MVNSQPLQRTETVATSRRVLRLDGRPMKSVRVLSHVTVVLAIFGPIGIVAAQQAQPAQERAEDSTLAYRLADGKTMHLDDAKKASDHLATVKKLGCEVSEGDHEGHGDIIYRCLKWKALTVADDKLAHQWEGWLKGAGFETLHGHAADDHDEHTADHEHHAEEAKEQAEEHGHEHGHEAGKHEEVVYRLPGWVTLHPQTVDEAQELIAIAKGLGCEVREDRHEGEQHGDVSIRCAEWTHVELPTHETAETWQTWMANIGFETRHEDE